MPTVVSMVTDFGLGDFYAGALKGSLLKETPTLQLVDICHNIGKFDVAEAAFALKNAYPYFGSNTIHIVCVNERIEGQTKHLVVKHNDHLFIGPDNGLFSIAFDGEPELAYELEKFATDGREFTYIFPMLAKTVQFIDKGGNINALGKPVYEIKKGVTLQPLVQDSMIKGAVIYIDSFGNAVINVDRLLFETTRRNRAFTLQFKRNERITEMSKFYHDAADGVGICLFNQQGYLEIAINKGSAGGKKLEAKGLLGLQFGDSVQIEFT